MNNPEAIIIYVMGVSGSGKSTVGKELALKLALPFFDADDFHPPENIKKMKAGIPLTDADRAGWLVKLQQVASAHSRTSGAVIACSALKQAYRDVLNKDMPAPVYWVLLQGSFELITTRLQQRKGHFMAPGLLQSQFETLELPGDAIAVDIASPVPDIIDYIVAQIRFNG